MLVCLTDTKGNDVWLNPIYIRAVRAKSKYTEIIIPHVSAMGGSIVKAVGSVQDVVEAINIGMPEILPPIALEDESGSGAGGAGGASAAALTG